ncbi:hypothetical protein ACEPAF_1380 [Sanghuangporus sanghuang]
MFSKSLSAVSIFALVLLLSCQVFAHTIIAPATGVSGTSARSDANTNVFTVTVTNFNGGKDGSAQIVDTSINPSGTGSSDSSVTITKNGVATPLTTGSVQVSGTLPAGTTCTGGINGASCLVSFTTGGGFGNCILVSQGRGTAAFASTTSGTTRSENGRDCHTDTNAAGTRLARSLKLRKSLGESLERNRSWIWAK